MTVGNGSTSAAAEALISSLNQDSGYGGSIVGDSALDGDLTDWQAGLLEDRPTPAITPREAGLDSMHRSYSEGLSELMANVRGFCR